MKQNRQRPSRTRDAPARSSSSEAYVRARPSGKVNVTAPCRGLPIRCLPKNASEPRPEMPAFEMDEERFRELEAEGTINLQTGSADNVN